MQSFPIIRYLRRLAAARKEPLPFILMLDGKAVMCRDERQAELIQHLFDTWTRDERGSSNVSTNAPAK